LDKKNWSEESALRQAAATRFAALADVFQMDVQYVSGVEFINAAHIAYGLLDDLWLQTRD
jgi:hypothetical protein